MIVTYCQSSVPIVWSRWPRRTMTSKWSLTFWLRLVSRRAPSFWFPTRARVRSFPWAPPSFVVAGQRDRDLELAARIGQSLLQRNHLLQERNEAVEEQLAQTLDQVASNASSNTVQISILSFWFLSISKQRVLPVDSLLSHSLNNSSTPGHITINYSFVKVPDLYQEQKKINQNDKTIVQMP